MSTFFCLWVFFMIEIHLYISKLLHKFKSNIKRCLLNQSCHILYPKCQNIRLFIGHFLVSELQRDSCGHLFYNLLSSYSLLKKVVNPPPKSKTDGDRQKLILRAYTIWIEAPFDQLITLKATRSKRNWPWLVWEHQVK